MAHLVKPWVVHWIDATTGKRAKQGSPGAKAVRSRARKWYGVGVPGYGKKRVPLATDKTAARRMLDTLIRNTEQGQAGVPDPGAGRKRLRDHLAEFETHVAAGLAARGSKKKKPDPKQVRLAVQRVENILDGCGLAHVGDLDDHSPTKLAAYLNGRVAKTRKDDGISHQTAAFYLAAARRFVWWLGVRKKAPIPAGLFDDIPGFEPDINRQHARRRVGPEELARVLEAARSGPEAEGIPGEDRYHLYLTAFATGFRVGELTSLTPAHFDLIGDRPAVQLAGKVSKNRQATAAQPLPSGVALQLAAFIVGKPKDKPLWPGSWTLHAARMLRVDLAAANVPYSTPEINGPQFADFHARRHSFLSALAAANVGPKVLQELARHSTARLTLEKYTHTDRNQLAGAVALLPIGGTPDPFAHLTREQLLLALGVAAGLLRWVFAPGSANPSANRNGDGREVPEIPAVRETG